MRLVERVRRERLPVGPDLVDELARLGFVLPLVDAELRVREAALDELLLQLRHDVHELLAHRLAELVRLAAREAGEVAREQHHLFLIDRDAVRVLEARLHLRVVVGDGLAALLAVDEVGDVAHGARTVQRVHGDEVRQLLGLQLHEVLLHARRFELEESGRLAAAEELVGLLVVVGNLVRVELACLVANLLRHARIVLPEKRDALLLDGKRLQSEEVHLQKSDWLDEVSVILSRQQLVFLLPFTFALRLLPSTFFRRRHDGEGFGDRIAGDDDAAGVDARLADAALEASGAFHELMDDGIVGVERGLEVGGFLAGLLEVDLRRVGDVRGELVRVRQRIVHHAADVLDRRLRGHLSERHDVRDVVRPVAARHVVEDALAAGVVEVDVDIGHGDAVGVEEAFEQEVVLERIDVGDPERIGDGRTRGGSAPGADPHAALLACGADVVADDEEVAGKAHQLDRVELELHAFLHVLRNDAFGVAPADLRAGPDERGEIVGLELDAKHLLVSAQAVEVVGLLDVELGLQLLLVELLRVALLGAELDRNRKLRHDRRRVELVLLDHVRDGLRVRDDFGTFGEEGAHLLLGLEVFLAGVDHALLVGHLLARRKREEDVMRIVVRRVEEVDVVRGDDADVELLPELEHALDDLDLALVEVDEVGLRRERDVGTGLRGLVDHHLERVVFAEEVLVPLRGALGLGHVPRVDRVRDFAGDARGGAVETLVVFLEEGVVDSRVVVEAVDVRLGHEADEVVVPRLVHRVEAKVMAVLVLVARLVVAGRGDVRLAAEDGLDADAGEVAVGLLLLRPALVVEALQGEKVAVVCDRQGGHAERARLADERHDLALPVEKRIGRVQVKMNEI